MVLDCPENSVGQITATAVECSNTPLAGAAAIAAGAGAGGAAGAGAGGAAAAGGAGAGAAGGIRSSSRRPYGHTLLHHLHSILYKYSRYAYLKYKDMSGNR
jgi:hypothetical protein